MSDILRRLIESTEAPQRIADPVTKLLGYLRPRLAAIEGASREGARINTQRQELMAALALAVPPSLPEVLTALSGHEADVEAWVEALPETSEEFEEVRQSVAAIQAN